MYGGGFFSAKSFLLLSTSLCLYAVTMNNFHRLHRTVCRCLVLFALAVLWLMISWNRVGPESFTRYMLL